MDALLLLRWQFAITTVYHFILVPITIGLAPLVAIMQTKWLKSGDAKWLKLSEFFGKILIINFALGVATGIVQEFQFGMGWSEYSRYVGDIFGAPLAFEALLAFFLESTFLGIWIFGRGRVTPKVHTAAIWLFAIGSDISALFILAANSFMQNPVGTFFNPETGRAELDGMGGFLKVIFSPTSMYAFFHTFAASLLVAGSLITAIALWWVVRNVKSGNISEAKELWKPAARFGLVTMLIGSIAVIGTGHFAGQHIMEVQPTKMSAAMGVFDTEEAVPLGLIYTGGENVVTLPIPGIESLMATNHLSGPESAIEGTNDLQQQFTEKFAEVYGTDVNYIPNIALTFYSFRAMMGFGFISLILSIIGLVAIKGDKLPQSTGMARVFIWTVPLPIIASTFGWILAESGRQPWVVYPNFPVEGDLPGGEMVQQLTMYGVSQTVPTVQVVLSLAIFTLLYLALGVVWFMLVKRYAQEGIDPSKEINTEVIDDSVNDAKLSFAY
ncbi:MAG: cytochrome ubiquinol oxidase subunit I [Actinomycetaceae bacterium]|nr:cytochrome ubiquinol oxidase subunit I [Arcanobacterium sp.]MDD7504665.1 cytochrome ubiquinol oxidase subunit I [Actinomycetaceae bacterium]MDY6143137.1 cytochrome ubiquinol oxidase subunit I [Arcanobacterium sp.]